MKDVRSYARLGFLLVCLAFLSMRPALAVSPAGDVVGKVTVGYQGWFACPPDGTPIDLWWHWASNEGAIPSNTNSVIHAWPDMREFTNQYQTGYPNLGDGQVANLFSSDDQQVVNTQFSWMEQNGIDTAALQRFNPTGGEGPERNQVTQKVIAAAASTGVKFYIMYDTSGWGSTFDTDMENDWLNVINNNSSINVTASPQYARQNGKPVVCIWGMGFNDGNHPTNVTQCINLINWFKNQGCYVIGGTPTYWRTEQSGGDSVSGFLSVYTDFNMISPWMVGRIGAASDSDNFRTNVNAGDVSYCNSNGIDYQPCVLPGDTGQRLHGTFMWEQFYNMIGVGAAGLYISMFDEFNEGNQISKTAEDSAMSPVGGVFQSNNTNVPFFTLDQDGTHCSSDFYLRETGDGDKMLKGEIGLTNVMPTLPVLTPASPTNLAATAGTGQVTLTWTASDETSSYNVYRSTSSGGEGSTPVVTGITGPPSGTFPRPTITYTNTGLANGATYYYTVAAVNPTGTSAQSNQASASLGGTSEGPFGGTPAAIPGTVQAENYDTGGQGVAYNVTSTNGSANSYRSDGIDLETTSDTGGGYDLGWTSAGQWFKYTVSVASAGTYSVAYRLASDAAVGTTGGSFHIQNASGTNLTGSVSVPGTGGWQTWTTVTGSITLSAGTQTLELFQDTGGYNINYLTFTGPPPPPTGLTATSGNAQVSLAWSTSTGATSYNVYRGTTSGGESSTAIATGLTSASYTNTGLTNGTTYYYKVAAVDSSGTSGLSSEVSATPESAEGPFGGTPAAVPGTVQAENYDTGGQGVAYSVSSINGNGTAYRSDGVDLETTSDTGGGYDLGWTTSGQWFNYTVNVGTAGAYTVTFRLAADAAVGSSGGSLHLQNSSGTNLTGEVNVPGTGGWQTWENVTATVTLPAGVQTLTLEEDAGGWNLNYMTFAASGGSAPPAPTGLSATSGSGDVALGWTGSTGAASYNVYRGTSSGGESSTAIASGLTGTSYTDTAVTGGTAYYYKVAAVDSAGTSGLSNEASATPTTALPDLIVTSISWTPTTLAVGSQVVFSCVVKNQGTGPTPAGVIVGVQFAIDGNESVITWSDTDTTSLAPGASVTLTCDNGTNGVNYWPATAGTHTVQAWVNDVDRFNESNLNNNKLTASITVP